MSELVLGVSAVREATPGSRIVRLNLNGAPFSYEPGQAAAIGPAELSARVPFSIASAPEETRQLGYVEFLIKVDAAGRWGMGFPSLVRGARVALDGPAGSFTFPDDPREQRFAFIAGGTGISPLRSMIRHAILAGIRGRLRLLYSARTPRDFAYLPELRGMVKRGELEMWVSATREVGPKWRGERGRINTAQLAHLVDDPATLCFVCGPAAMVADVPPLLQALGVDSKRIRLEDW